MPVSMKPQNIPPHPLPLHTHMWSQLEKKSCFYPPLNRKEGSQGCCLLARRAREIVSSSILHKSATQFTQIQTKKDFKDQRINSHCFIFFPFSSSHFCIQNDEDEGIYILKSDRSGGVD